MKREITIEEWEEWDIAELVVLLQGAGIKKFVIDASVYWAVITVEDDS